MGVGGDRLAKLTPIFINKREIYQQKNIIMYNRFKTICNCLILFALGVTFAACSGNDEPADTTPLTIESQSIKDGDEVSVSTTSMTIVYSHPVATGSSNITLNGTVVVPTVANKTITIPLSLAEGTTYALNIPSGAIVRRTNTSISSASMTVNFTTPSKAVPSIGALSNANATTQAKNVYNYLLTQYGQKVLSGTMANVNNNNDFADLIYSITNTHPAVTGYDFIHLPYSPANWIDYSDISAAKTQWENNGLVTYMWHWLVPPTQGAAISEYTYSANNGFDIRNALTSGTWENEQILADIEKVAGYLKLLQDAGIPVLWRPLHEAAGSYTAYGSNGAWFWWGDKGAEYTKQLWILLYDKLVNEYQLNNLIWVWTVQYMEGFEAEALAAYPGDEYVDIVGTDIYSSNTNSKITEFNFINNNVTKGKKMITLSECGNIPNPTSMFSSGDTWSWFMVWYTLDSSGKLVLTDSSSDIFKLNDNSYWTTVTSNANVVNREDMPSLK